MRHPTISTRRPDERAVPRLLDDLGSHFDAHTGWVFVTRDRSGALALMSNQRPEQIREILRTYLETKRARKP